MLTTPMDKFIAATQGVSDPELLSDALWLVIDDVQQSYTLAMQDACVSKATVKIVTMTVNDYLTNNYGDA